VLRDNVLCTPTLSSARLTFLDPLSDPTSQNVFTMFTKFWTNGTGGPIRLTYCRQNNTTFDETFVNLNGWRILPGIGILSTFGIDPKTVEGAPTNKAPANTLLGYRMQHVNVSTRLK
jgi:hypothetical protein